MAAGQASAFDMLAVLGVWVAVFFAKCLTCAVLSSLVGFGSLRDGLKKPSTRIGPSGGEAARTTSIPHYQAPPSGPKIRLQASV